MMTINTLLGEVALYCLFGIRYGRGSGSLRRSSGVHGGRGWDRQFLPLHGAAALAGYGSGCLLVFIVGYILIFYNLPDFETELRPFTKDSELAIVRRILRLVWETSDKRSRDKGISLIDSYSGDIPAVAFIDLCIRRKLEPFLRYRRRRFMGLIGLSRKEFPPAIFWLGSDLEYGKNGFSKFPRNKKLSQELVTCAASLRHPIAQFEEGTRLLGSENREAGILLLEEACASGISSACDALLFQI